MSPPKHSGEPPLPNEIKAAKISAKYALLGAVLVALIGATATIIGVELDSSGTSQSNRSSGPPSGGLGRAGPASVQIVSLTVALTSTGETVTVVGTASEPDEDIYALLHPSLPPGSQYTVSDPVRANPAGDWRASVTLPADFGSFTASAVMGVLVPPGTAPPTREASPEPSPDLAFDDPPQARQLLQEAGPNAVANATSSAVAHK